MVISVLYFILVVYGFNSLFPLRVLPQTLIAYRQLAFLFSRFYRLNITRRTPRGQKQIEVRSCAPRPRENLLYNYIVYL